MTATQLTENLQPLMANAVTELIANNASSVASELNDAPEGKVKVSVGISLTLINTKLYLQASLGYSRKFSDEFETMCDIDDPQQPKLSGLEGETVTIKTGEKSVTVTRAKSVQRLTKSLLKPEKQ